MQGGWSGCGPALPKPLQTGCRTQDLESLPECHTTERRDVRVSFGAWSTAGSPKHWLLLLKQEMPTITMKRETQRARTQSHRGGLSCQCAGPRAQLAQGISSGTWWTPAPPELWPVGGRLNAEP